MIKTILDHCNLEKVDFEEAKMQGAKLRFAYLDKANFKETILDGADFRNSVLGRASFFNASLVKTDFRGCDLTNVDNLTQTQYELTLHDENTILPSYF